MKRILIAMTAAALTLGLGVGVSTAHADQAQAPSQGADGGRRHEKLVFPMKGDEFQKHIDARLAKIKDKIEHKIAEKQVPADKAKEIRDRFAANAAQVSAATKQAVADGVVTEDEAKQVRQVMHAMHPHKGHKHDGDKSARHEKR